MNWYVAERLMEQRRDDILSEVRLDRLRTKASSPARRAFSRGVMFGFGRFLVLAGRTLESRYNSEAASGASAVVGFVAQDPCADSRQAIL